jgi:organic radical activating enzyme
MNILATRYTLPLKSLDVYVAGCSGLPHCVNCHNKESWNFNCGELYNEGYFDKIKIKVESFNIMIDNIMLFGGEPLDQNHDELLHMLLDLKSLNKDIWLFTRYDINKIPKEIKILCDYIKCGRYLPELACEDNIYYGIKLATSNQKIYKKR